MNALLDIHQVSCRFGGVRALHDVSLTVKNNEIFGLIGPNGAGKTTLFNVITGLVTPTSGNVTLDGCSLTGLAVHDILRHGLARTFQNIRLFPGLSVLENVLIGRHSLGHAGIWGAISRNQRTKREETELRDTAHQLLQQVGIHQHAQTLARNLPYGDQRRLEIARALASEPKLLALDEPAAGMGQTERDALRELILSLRAQRHISILIIEHDVKWMMALCDRIAVLHFGERIALDVPERIRQHPDVIAAYLGSAS